MYRRSLLEWHNHIVHRIRGTPLFCPCSRIGPQNISVLINENVNLVSSVEESDRPAGNNISPALSKRPTMSLTRWTVRAARKSHPLASVHSIMGPSTLSRVVSQRSAQDRAAVSRATCAAQFYFGQACSIVSTSSASGGGRWHASRTFRPARPSRARAPRKRQGGEMTRSD